MVYMPEETNDKEQFAELLKELFKEGRIEIFLNRQKNGVKVIIDGELVQED